MGQILTDLGVTLPLDVVLFGDGSGSGHDKPNGWGCVLIDMHTGERESYYGGTNKGSVNMAEVLPYIQALTHFHNVGRGKQLLETQGVCRVAIVTDSSYTATAGSQAADLTKPLPAANRALMAAIRQLCRDGYLLSFYHQHRSETGLNLWADLVSFQSRLAIERGLEEVQTGTVDKVPLKEINP